MRHKTKRKRSKLKLRPYGVITIQPDEIGQGVEKFPSDKVKKPISRKPSGRMGTKAILSLLKGLSIFLLLALVLRWNATESQNNRLQSNAESTSSVNDNAVAMTVETNNTSEDVTLSSDTASASVETSEDNPTEAEIEIVETEVIQDSTTQTIPTIESSSTSVVSDGTELQNIQDITASATENTSVTTEIISQDSTTTTIQTIESSTVSVVSDDTEWQVTEELNAPVTEYQSESFEQSAPDSTTDSLNQSFIRTYRASVFTNLSENSTETPINQGTMVNILEWHGDWAKIEAPGNDISGFIHKSHLNI